ncbi:C4-dicarboxylate ABC transporter [Pelistega indica]|uniref:TRAP transporter large permease protein n=1 Tax=Pelistega indica TaxID=1414851 RepID=V8G3D1_9BURK|nr:MULTISPECIES: TRAP transporter large permease [Pelistega]ETD70601.1 C4-dicarboxylate ABC transporter [Pelistega indica]
MIAALLFILFAIFLIIGVPVAIALGVSGIVAIVFNNLDTTWFGLMSVPQSFYAGLSKYPLLAIPMFVLLGTIFERSGVALRIVNFATAVIGRGPGMLPMVSVLVAMFMGGISGSGPASAAAVGGVMIGAMTKAGYKPEFSASVVAAGAATDILIPPSVAFIIYAILVPQASVLDLFVAGAIPGLLAGISIIIPAIYLSRKYKMGLLEKDIERPAIWPSFVRAFWGLTAPALLLSGMRLGWFTPTEAAVVAVFYGLFIGMVIYRTITFKDLLIILRDSAELSAVILFVVTIAGIFAWALSTLSIIDPITKFVVNSGLGEYTVLLLLILLLIIFGMFLDGISIFLIFVPILLPIAEHFQWDLVWFGVLLTMMVAIGQFTPPLAVNLMVSCRIAKVPIESTVRWVLWMLGGMCVALLLLVIFPDLVTALPRYLNS